MEDFDNLANNHISDEFCKYCGAEMSRSRFVDGKNGLAVLVYWDACICCGERFRVQIYIQRIDGEALMPVVEISKRHSRDLAFHEGEIIAPLNLIQWRYSTMLNYERKKSAILTQKLRRN